MRFQTLAAGLTLSLACNLSAQAPPPVRAKASTTSTDSSFAQMQERGKQAMGVDQYTSVHHFDALPNGGRIELLRSSDDSAGIAQIRAHIREIAIAFKSGDFSTPAFVHMQTVPGAQEMAAKRAVITYQPHDLPRGAELQIRTDDADALHAIHQFMEFQRSDHHAGGMVDTKAHPIKHP